MRERALELVEHQLFIANASIRMAERLLDHLKGNFTMADIAALETQIADTKTKQEAALKDVTDAATRAAASPVAVDTTPQIAEVKALGDTAVAISTAAKAIDPNVTLPA